MGLAELDTFSFLYEVTPFPPSRWRLKNSVKMEVVDISEPRKVNAQAIILRESTTGYDVLVQLRSMSMKAMPGHLAALGGQRDRTDTDSRHTALREVKEECGLMSKCAKGPIKFAEGARCDWYVMLLKKPTFESKAKSRHECGDIKSVISLLPSSMQPAECYGHAWIPTSDIQNIDPKLPLMGGTLAEYNDLKRLIHDHFCYCIFLIRY